MTIIGARTCERDSARPRRHDREHAATLKQEGTGRAAEKGGRVIIMSNDRSFFSYLLDSLLPRDGCIVCFATVYIDESGSHEGSAVQNLDVPQILIEDSMILFSSGRDFDSTITAPTW